MRKSSITKRTKDRIGFMKEKIFVLHVDDEIGFLELTKIYLEQQSKGTIIVDSISQSDEVIERLKDKQYDVIVSDFRMDPLNGLELLKLLRSKNEYIPFIIFTGYDNKELSIDALNLGADYYVKKETNPERHYIKLEHAIRKVVMKKKLYDTLKGSENKHFHLSQEFVVEKENEFRSSYKPLNTAIFILKDSYFLQCTDMASEMFKCPKEQIIGQTPCKFSPLMQPDGRNSREKAWEKISEALSGKKQFFHWVHLSSDNVCFNTTISLERFELNNELLTLAVVRDISENTKEELLIIESTNYKLISKGGISEFVQGKKNSVVEKNKDALIIESENYKLIFKNNLVLAY